MKKYLFSALALPLLFACSSDDLIEKEVASNDQFKGIEKVDATFSMDEGVITRFDGGKWVAEENDKWGFAWLTDAYTGLEGDALVPITGKAYQNHNLIQTSGIFTPQTSIYVGKYFLYRPYDYSTVSPQAINFKSLIDQPMAEGYESEKQPWKDLAKTAINIGDKWTEVTPAGTIRGGETWNKAGIKEHYQIYAAMFSNQTGLDLTYTKNNPTFNATTNIQGATDIDYDIAKGDAAGAAKLYGATVKLAGAANSFTYAPTAEPMTAAGAEDHIGTFWANKKKTDLDNYTGFTFTDGDDALITLTAPGDPIGTGAEGNTGWFWFNSLPITSGDAAVAEPTAANLLAIGIETKIKTSYGTVTVNSTVGECAYEGYNFGTKENPNFRWCKLANEDLNANAAATTAINWDPTRHNTFVNHFGNHKGKYSLDVDFSTAVMDIHIVDDEHLQTYLKFYMASGKTQGANLVLDGDDNNSFRLSKLSIALLQTINRNLPANAQPVKVAPCTIADEDHNAPEGGRVKIIVTQDGQTTDELKDLKAVPDLKDVFATKAVFTEEAGEVEVAPVPVYLASNTEWTWGSEIGTDGDGILPIDGQVASITNEGTLNVTNTNVQLSLEEVPLYNANGATMNIKAKTAVKNPLTNLGVINVEAKKELRAYGVDIINDAEDLLTPTDIITNDPAVPADATVGVINNYGVVGVSANTDGKFYNYGKIIMKTADAITLLTSNEKSSVDGKSAFGQSFNKQTNKMGTVVLPDGEPEAIVSVSNTAENGFIMYKWNAATYSHATGNIKYNTIIVDKDIEFTGEERSTEIQFILFNGEKTKVVNPGVPVAASRLSKLKGIIVNDGKSVIIEKTNRLNCLVGAYLGEDATVYRGGVFELPDGAETNYFGTWEMEEQVVEW
jgi:hypothetical protein